MSWRIWRDAPGEPVSAVETGKATVRLDVVLGLLRVLGLQLRVESGRGGIVADD